MSATLGWSLARWLVGGIDDDSRNHHSERSAYPTPHLTDAEARPSEREADSHSLTAARDAEWIRRIRDGDPDAFAAIMEAYANMLGDVVYRIVKTDGVPQEIVQDVFFRIWRTRGQLDIHGNVAAYLVRAARNLALNVVRRDHLQQRFAQDVRRGVLAERTASVNDGSVDPDLDTAVRAAIDELTPRIREAFLLHIDQGLRAPEIAAILGVTPATVHSLIYRATKQLAARLNRWL